MEGSCINKILVIFLRDFKIKEIILWRIRIVLPIERGRRKFNLHLTLNSLRKYSLKLRGLIRC